MNSYPIELLVQHAPLMFVAGLELPKAKQDPFHTLITRLREVLSARPKGLVWDKNRGSAFNILLVDKDMKFPPRKVVATTEHGSTSPHSPLSPLVPSSPLYPDGLIAPVWVRKHVELVPSIFVFFLRLWEAPPPLSPLEGREQEMEEERFHDQELATELSTRKRTLAERGIKLTAVLLASRKLLDDPGLDSRLTFLRRQSSLDARAALFVLSPVSTGELQDFVRSLTEALREPSLEYYAAHSKRVRRKRNKHTNSAYSGYPTSAVATTRSVPLRPIGWTVRYEYKMGTFAEFRFEEEVARKHFEDCWTGLSEMFNSTTMLPPRTKRWAEAKVLADSIAIKIYKLYLYNNEHSLALSWFHRHVRRYCDLSKGWGIGEDTFEYWSWLARQYRVLAELLEIALRAGLRLPSLLPQHPEEHPLPQLALEPMPIPGRAPSSTLQHPGFYYFQAAKCTEERLKRFKAIEEAETRQVSVISQTPAFNNEKKVDHWEIILELYSKAYEQFKRYAAGGSRLTFFIAVQIATTYHSSGKHDLAVKFFERIVKVYHKERWPAMLVPILAMWYDSAKQLGSIDTCIKLLFERMSLSSQIENAGLAADLEAIMTTTEPSPDLQPLRVELSPVEQILSTSIVFYEKESSVGTSTPFQIQVTAPDTTCLHFLPVASLTFHFSNDRPPITVKHARKDEPSRIVSLGDIGTDGSSSSEPFTLAPGVTQILRGTISSTSAAELKVSKVTLKIETEKWVIDVDFTPTATVDFEPTWLYASEDDLQPIPLGDPDTDPSSVIFRSPFHDFKVDISHAGSALVGEDYPISISILNQDARPLDILFDVLLQPSENETVNYISIGEERSTNLLRGMTFGLVEPGSHVERIIFLTTTGGAGKHVLDISIQSRTTGDSATENETLRTLTIDSREPFGCESNVTYGQPQDGLPMFPNVMDLNKQEPLSAQANVITTIECLANCELEIEAMKLIDLESNACRLLYCSLDESELEHMRWVLGDQFAVDTGIGICSVDEDEFSLSQVVVPSPVQLQISWRRANGDSNNSSFTKSTLLLPELKPPTIGLSVIVDPPAVVKVHVPFSLTLKIRNNDPHRSADLVFALEPTDGFVAAGFRSGALPLLLPGTEDKLSFNLIPLVTGVTKLPTFKVHRAVKADPGSPGRPEDGSTPAGLIGDVIPVVDERWNEMDEAANNVHFYARDGTALTTELDLTLWLSVLVAPR